MEFRWTVEIYFNCAACLRNVNPFAGPSGSSSVKTWKSEKRELPSSEKGLLGEVSLLSVLGRNPNLDKPRAKLISHFTKKIWSKMRQILQGGKCDKSHTTNPSTVSTVLHLIIIISIALFL